MKGHRLSRLLSEKKATRAEVTEQVSPKLQREAKEALRHWTEFQKALKTVLQTIKSEHGHRADAPLAATWVQNYAGQLGNTTIDGLEELAKAK